MTKTELTLKQEIEKFEYELKLWQESHDLHQDGCNVTALHDLRHGHKIIKRLQEVVEAQRKSIKYLEQQFFNGRKRIEIELRDQSGEFFDQQKKLQQILGE